MERLQVVKKYSRPDISLSVFFPAYNEEENIKETVLKTNDVVSSITPNYEIIVVDDGSSDRTAEIVKQLQQTNERVVLVQHNPNRGYGAALLSGIRAAKYDWVFFTDADLQFRLDEIPALVEYVPMYDVVMGYRAPRKDPFMRLVNATGWNMLNRLLFGLKIKDIDCAFKLFRRDIVAALPLESEGAMLSAEMLIRLQRQNIAIKEIPVTHLPRTKGNPTGAKPAVILRALKEMWGLYRGDLGETDTTTMQILKFGSVGVLNTLVDIGIYFTLTRSMTFFESHLLYAKVVSFVAGTICSYILNRTFTFKVVSPVRLGEFVKFYASTGVGLVINVSSLYVFHDLLHMYDLVGVILATIVTFVWGFISNKLWVFNKPSGGSTIRGKMVERPVYEGL